MSIIRIIASLALSPTPSPVTFGGLRFEITDRPGSPVVVVPAADIVVDANGLATAEVTITEAAPGPVTVVVTSLDDTGAAIPGFTMTGSGVVPTPSLALKPTAVTITVA